MLNDMPMTHGDAWRFAIVLLICQAISGGEIIPAFIRGLTGQVQVEPPIVGQSGRRAG